MKKFKRNRSILELDVEEVKRSLELIECNLRLRLKDLSEGALVGMRADMIATTVSIPNILREAKNKLPAYFRHIKEERSQAHNYSGMKIAMVPDVHIDKVVGFTSRASKKRQKQIVTFLENYSGIVFAEGSVEGTVTWKSHHQNGINFHAKYHANCPDLVPVKLEEYKRLMNETDQTWIFECLDNPRWEIYGIDDWEISQAVQVLIGAANNTPDPDLQQYLKETFELLNFCFRDQLILAKMVSRLTQREKTEAVLVIGKDHIETLRGIKDWNIALEVAELPDLK